MFFVRPQSTVENYSEVGGRGWRSVGLRHEGKSGGLVRRENF